MAKKPTPHDLFLGAIPGKDPANINISYLSKRLGCPNTKLWRYANGRCAWELELWVKTMVALGEYQTVLEFIDTVHVDVFGTSAA